MTKRVSRFMKRPNRNFAPTFHITYLIRCVCLFLILNNALHAFDVQFDFYFNGRKQLVLFSCKVPVSDGSRDLFVYLMHDDLTDQASRLDRQTFCQGCLFFPCCSFGLSLEVTVDVPFFFTHHTHDKLREYGCSYF